MEHAVEVVVELGESGLFTARATCDVCGFSTRTVSPDEDSAFATVKPKASEHATTGQFTVVTAAEMKTREERAEQLVRKRKQDLTRDLDADPLSVLKGDKSSYLDVLSKGDVEEIILQFVTTWCRENLSGYVPDPEQARVIASVGHHALVSARAGSGKTSTMVARAAFLIKACGVDPNSIMLLAFNRAAAEQLGDRVARVVEGARPHAMTFHSLAYRLVHPRENLILDESKEKAAQSRAVQDAVDAFIRNPETQELVKKAMLAYFRNDWEAIVFRGDTLSPAEQVQYRRSLQHESLGGDYVKSKGEKVIANILLTFGVSRFQRDVLDGPSYGYEHEVSSGVDSYKPDFSIYDKNKKRIAVVEFFGMKGQLDYDEQMKWKQDYWLGNPEVEFIEYFPKDVDSPDFEERFVRRLEELGLPLRRLSDDEIWAQIETRAIDSFSSAVAQVINRARQQRWDGKALREAWGKSGSPESSMRDWIDVSADVLDEYEANLVKNEQEDFTGLMWRAVD